MLASRGPALSAARMRIHHRLAAGLTLGALVGACSGGASRTTTASSSSSSSSSSSGAASTTSTSGATTGVATTGSTASAGSTTSSGATTGNTGPYQPFDGGPHTVLLPSGAAADAGCTLAAPVLTDAGFCVECLGDPDCPAGLYCETDPSAVGTNTCRACASGHPACGAGLLCDLGLTDTCVPDCTALDCQTSAGGYCNKNPDGGTGVGCVLGCRTSADCPATAPVCDSATGTCGDGCTVGGPGTGGCPAGTLCTSGTFGQPVCGFDCRTDAGACRPGYCDADAGQGSIACASGCTGDVDCAGSLTPRCVTGACAQCATDSDCAALGIGLPICLGGSCGNDCTSDPLGCALCIDGGTGYTCGCYQNSDCASQAATPDCLPLDPDAGLNADAGRFGTCGCTPTGCGPGKVCEDRYGVLSALTANPPTSQCVSSCVGGGLPCPRTLSEPVCNAATGYCVTCTSNADCSADAGVPVCLPVDAGPYGEGQCGCTPTACSDNRLCDPSSLSCQPACSYLASGYDSCLYGAYPQSQLCNSETGTCQQCFIAADCAGQTGLSPLNISYPLRFCSDAGSCVGCNTAADCPANAPGCSLGVCGACATALDCKAGMTCAFGACATACTGDAGQCATDAGATRCYQNACVQCVLATDCPAPGALCVNGACF